MIKTIVVYTEPLKGVVAINQDFEEEIRLNLKSCERAIKIIKKQKNIYSSKKTYCEALEKYEGALSFLKNRRNLK